MPMLIYFELGLPVLLSMSHSLKVLYTSRISYRVLNLVFSREEGGGGGGALFPNFKP